MRVGVSWHHACIPQLSEASWVLIWMVEKVGNIFPRGRFDHYHGASGTTLWLTNSNQSVTNNRTFSGYLSFVLPTYAWKQIQSHLAIMHPPNPSSGAQQTRIAKLDIVNSLTFLWGLFRIVASIISYWCVQYCIIPKYVSQTCVCSFVPKTLNNSVFKLPITDVSD